MSFTPYDRIKGNGVSRSKVGASAPGRTTGGGIWERAPNGRLRRRQPANGKANGKAKGRSNAGKQTRSDKLGAATGTTLKRSGKRKVRRKRRIAKVSKAMVNTIKNIINKSEENEKNTSTYYKEWVGDLTPMSFTSHSPVYSGWGWFFSHLCTNANDAASATSLTVRTTEANRFLPITTKKIIDAASILFNLRTPPLDYTQVLTDGAGPPVRVNGLISTNKTVLDLVYAAATWELKNTTEIIYEVVEYVVTNKDSSDQSFMSTWKQMFDEMNYASNGVAPALVEMKARQLSGSTTGDTNETYFFMATHLTMEPNMFKGLKNRYSWQRNVIRLEPGQSIKRHFVYQKKFINFDLARDNQGNVCTYVQGEQQVVYRFVPLLTHAFNETTDKGPSYYNVQGGFNAARAIDIRRKEVYRMYPFDNAANSDQKTVYKVDYGDSVIADKLTIFDPSPYTEVTAAAS